MESGTLTQTLPDGTRVYTLPIRMWEGSNPNGPAAVALVSDSDGLLQFLAVGTVDVTANGGLADGNTAEGVGNTTAGDSHYWDSDGNYLGSDPSTPGVICFAIGTQIRVEHGACFVEDLRVGDKLRTRENGLQTIRWIGRRTLSSEALARHPDLRPIRIRAGALGESMPSRDLILSPQHRIVVRSKIAIRMFEAEEVFVAAKHLLGAEGVAIEPDLYEVTYFHLLCDNHEIARGP